MSATLKVLNAVMSERIRQDIKWGAQDHPPADWIMILGEEFGEVCEAALRMRFGDSPGVAAMDYRAELVQVAAVAVAMIECLDRQGSRDDVMKRERPGP